MVTVAVEHDPGRPVRLSVAGPGIRSVGECAVTAGEDGTARAEIPGAVDGLAPGERREITVTAVDGPRRAVLTGEFTAAEPGWTMFLVSHFHYDPVWWNTQAA